MEKYKTIVTEVEAEEWHIGDINPLVIKHKGCGYRMCDACGGLPPTETIYYCKTLISRHQYIKDDDWIVKSDKGIFIYSNDEFLKRYEK